MALSEDYAQLYDEQGKDYAQRIVEAAGRMEQMIEALLTYSPNDRQGYGLNTVPDDRYVPITVHYSFSTNVVTGSTSGIDLSP